MPKKKIIIQDYISGLDGDYKVLIYDKKYYVLRRYNCKNDFRASGSGIFVFEENIPRAVLDFAEKVFNIVTNKKGNIVRVYWNWYNQNSQTFFHKDNLLLLLTFSQIYLFAWYHK